MFDVLRDEVRQRLPEPIKKLARSWYRNAMLHPYFLALLACMFICWFGWALLGKEIVNWWAGSIDKPYENAAQLGDSFGILNTLFAGIAALGATFAYLAQSKQLRDAQDAAEDAKAADDKRQFEGTFFQMLRGFGDLTNSIVLRQSEWVASSTGGRNEIEVERRGAEVFGILAYQFSKGFAEISGSLQSAEPSVKSQVLRDEYERFFNLHSQNFSHYFRTLYRLLSFVHGSGRTDTKAYGKIVRAQLTDHELYFLFFNGLVEQGRKMNKFVDAYALLKHLPKSGGYPTSEQRKWLGDETGPNGEEISPAYCDEEDRIEIQAKCSAQLSSNP